MWILRRSAIFSLVLSACRAEKRFYTASADCGPFMAGSNRLALSIGKFS